MVTNTMAKTAVIHTRVEPALKKSSEEVLGKLGLSTSEFISMTLSQLVMQQGLPFEARIPNIETQAIIRETDDAVKSGSANSFSSVDGMMDFLESDDDV